MRLTPAIHLLFLLLTVAVRASSIGRASVNSTACDRAKQGVEALQKNYYDPHLGLWGCGAWMSSAPSSRALAGPAPGWWNCACSFEAIVDYMDAAGDASYAAVIENSYRATLPIFSLKCDQEDSMDDIAWWGTAWARAGACPVQCSRVFPCVLCVLRASAAERRLEVLEWHESEAK